MHRQKSPNDGHSQSKNTRQNHKEPVRTKQSTEITESSDSIKHQFENKQPITTKQSKKKKEHVTTKQHEENNGLATTKLTENNTKQCKNDKKTAITKQHKESKKPITTKKQSQNGKEPVTTKQHQDSKEPKQSKKNKKRGKANKKLIKTSQNTHSKHSICWIDGLTSNKILVLAFLLLTGTAVLLQNIIYGNNFFTFLTLILTDFSSSSNGGWKQANEDTLKKYNTSLCSVDRIFHYEMTVEKFKKEYRNKKPVIIVFGNGARDWTNVDQWSVESLKHYYAKQTVSMGRSREIVQYSGNGYLKTTFGEFVDKLAKNEKLWEPYYVFDRAFIESSNLLETLRLPTYLQVDEDNDDSFFFLGSSGSGVSFHNHAEAWNGVIYGAKRWFLYSQQTAPPGGVNPGYSQLDWFTNVYPELSKHLKPSECVQQAGEIIYVPEGMYHGTINIGDTIAIGIQKKDATLPEMKLQYEENQLSQQSETDRSVIEKRFEIIKKLHQLLPENSEWEMRLGAVLFEHLKQPDEGIYYTERALERDPLFLVARINLANFLSLRGEIEDAEKMFLVAMRQNQNAWDVYAQYGSFLFRQSRFSEAASLFRKGFDLKPNEKQFLVWLLECEKQLGDHRAAESTKQRLKHFQYQ